MSEETAIANSTEVTVKVHHKPACKVELEVHATSRIVKKARDEALKEINKEVSFAGFRKGKAPTELVLKHHPKSVEMAWHKAIANLVFPEAQMQARIHILKTGSPVTFNLKKHSLDEGADLTFFFETEPQIPVVDPIQFQRAPVEKKEVGDKEVDEAIKQMQFFYASWTSIEGRGIQDGDYIIIDLDTLDEPQERIFNHIRFEVSTERMAEWMQKLVIGAKAGDILEGTSYPDEKASEEERQEFKHKKVKVTIHKAEVARLPVVDDEFAKKVGSSDVASMRSFIFSLLKMTVDKKAESDLRSQVNHFLSTSYPFELPLSLIEMEYRHRMEDSSNKAKNLPEEEKKRHSNALYQEACESIRLYYLSHQILNSAKIPVTRDEVLRRAVSNAQQQGRRTSTEQISKEEFSLALSKVILAKAQDYILEKSMPAEPITEKSAEPIMEI